jgi:hypothetical protein
MRRTACMLAVGFLALTSFAQTQTNRVHGAHAFSRYRHVKDQSLAGQRILHASGEEVSNHRCQRVLKFSEK